MDSSARVVIPIYIRNGSLITELQLNDSNCGSKYSKRFDIFVMKNITKNINIDDTFNNDRLK